ncbi:MAG: SsrA-binding protein SmpB [Clostridia bacterium]|nr:SsrA-binding protein SmpB [Clostridia bacterium]
MSKNSVKTIARNKKAFHEYFIEDTVEAGIQLIGCEVKSIRDGEVNLQDSYAQIVSGEMFLKSCYIKFYDKGSFSNVESRRDRKLLLHKQQINRLYSKVKEKGFSIVPLSMYFNQSLVKVELALVKGKLLYDKREAIAKKDEMRRKQRLED